mmetsp:Transcript_6188/g.15367  ORF Transcript_6188/g.15367 Transcript_6188/m.15367 type:complete len:83 (-) Transcript_6188:470-718(-)
MAQENIEDKGQASSDVVKGNLHPLQAQIVKGDHSHEDEGKREDLSANRGIVFHFRELREETLAVPLALLVVFREREHVFTFL